MSTELKQILLEIKVVKMEIRQTRRDLEDIGSSTWHKLSDDIYELAAEIQDLQDELTKINANNGDNKE